MITNETMTNEVKASRISGTDFINMRLSVYNSHGTVDDLVTLWREATNTDQTDKQVRQYMGTRTGVEKKKLIGKGFTDNQIKALLPSLKKASRTDSTAFVDSMKNLLMNLGVSTDLSSPPVDYGNTTDDTSFDTPDVDYDN